MLDVVLVGCGPVGALLANLLGQAGLRVGVYERDRDEPYYAGSASMGVADAFRPDRIIRHVNYDIR